MTYRPISRTSSDTVLTPRSTIIFEKLTVAKLLKIFQAFNRIPNVHSRVHNSQPLSPVLSQIIKSKPSHTFFKKVKVKVKFALKQAMKSQRGVQV